ncbi:hypothetical protein Tco_0232438 [Tanacetum coccineum]
MDWLSKRKFAIVCYEKVVRIPLEGDETLRVHGEHTQGVVKILMNTKEWNSGDDQLRLRWVIYLVVLADAAERVRDAIGFECCLVSSSGWTKSHVLWAEIGESSLTGLGLRLPKELNSVHDTFYVSNLKKCLADANLHVPLDEIKGDKTLRFVEEPVEIMDRGIKKLKIKKDNT